MSSQLERAEKICLNCNAHLHGRFCHACGQENIRSQQTFWGFVKHFFDDLTHFDNKFFRTVQYITTRPGVMARDYCAGKRGRFVPPVRAYLFTSAVFFLFFFNMRSNEDIDLEKKQQPITQAERAALVRAAEAKLKRRPKDSGYIRQLAILNDSTRFITQAALDSLDKPNVRISVDDNADTIKGVKVKTVEDYRRVQASLPEAKRDGWLERMMKERNYTLMKKYEGKQGEMGKNIANVFLHLVPYMLFLSLPFFAAVLKLLYVRQRQWYYSDHAVFTLHYFIFVFISIFLLLVSGKLNDATGWKIFNWVNTILGFAIPVYFVIAMRRFYQQSWSKTILKFFLFTFLWLFISIFLFALFMGVTFFQA